MFSNTAVFKQIAKLKKPLWDAVKAMRNAFTILHQIGFAEERLRIFWILNCNISYFQAHAVNCFGTIPP